MTKALESDTLPTHPPTVDPRSARLALLVACGAAFVAFLDLSVVNIAFPSIADDFTSVPTTTLTWVVSGYAVAFAAFLTPAGRFADTIGRKRVFLGALIGFALTSLLCALAPDVSWLIAGRILQGASASLMIPAGLGLVLGVTAPERIGTAIAAWTAAGGFAATVGPGIGGALVDWFGWRSVFMINVPVVAALVTVGVLIAADVPRGGRGLPDLVGTVATALGIGAVVAAVTEGQQWDWDWRTWLCVGAGAVLLAVALVRSRRHPRPAIPVGLWRNREYALTNAASFVFGVTMFAWLLAGPLWLDAIWGFTVLESAAAMSVGAIAAMVGAVVAGRASADTQRSLGVIGALLFAASTLYMSTGVWGADPALWSAWVPAGVLGGTGIGMAITVLGTSAASSSPPQQFAAGIGMNLTSQQAGGALGVAILAAILAADPGRPLTAFHTLFAVCAAVALAAAACIAIPTRPNSTAIINTPAEETNR
ncbi:MFS transporter [Gordonia rhizosphera]|uniref:Putative drug resistance transporter n=1 Tax=Gordonia rhizosphera NBRC 16068 TaxID=1108045 RepID=K6X4R1_9ACTN|nr:MFS transporter [Gordonia rhizosphera]GAB93779.1 putative drug resistance transporter [Gordonia rhizosphera NBRC 16068]